VSWLTGALGPLSCTPMCQVDLIMEKKITLTEALCGSAVHIQHLDGRVLRIATPPGMAWPGALLSCDAQLLGAWA